MGSESIAHVLRPKAEQAIDSEAMRNNCFSKIQLVGQKYRGKTTLASKTRFRRHCSGFQSRRFSLPVGYNIQQSSSLTNQNAALIIDHQLDFTKERLEKAKVTQDDQFYKMRIALQVFEASGIITSKVGNNAKLLFVIIQHRRH